MPQERRELAEDVILSELPQERQELEEDSNKCEQILREVPQARRACQLALWREAQRRSAEGGARPPASPPSQGGLAGSGPAGSPPRRRARGAVLSPTATVAAALGRDKPGAPGAPGAVGEAAGSAVDGAVLREIVGEVRT